MNYDINENDRERIYIPDDQMMSASVIRFEEDVQQFIRENDRDVVIDMKKVSKIDSMAIAAIIRIKNRLTEKGKQLHVYNPNEAVLRVLELAGLDSFLLE
jgi:anti-anti-sigma factor